MAEYLFNIDNGYLEGLVRGFRSGILNRADYLNLVQCETVEGKRTPAWQEVVPIFSVCLAVYPSDSHSVPHRMFMAVSALQI